MIHATGSSATKNFNFKRATLLPFMIPASSMPITAGPIRCHPAARARRHRHHHENQLEPSRTYMFLRVPEPTRRSLPGKTVPLETFFVSISKLPSSDRFLRVSNTWATSEARVGRVRVRHCNLGIKLWTSQYETLKGKKKKESSVWQASSCICDVQLYAVYTSRWFFLHSTSHGRNKSMRGTAFGLLHVFVGGLP